MGLYQSLSATSSLVLVRVGKLSVTMGVNWSRGVAEFATSNGCSRG